jgi:hypothetical protein
MTIYQKRLAIVVGSAILADVVCWRLRISAKIDHEAVLTILAFGTVILANEKQWRTRLFWSLIVSSFCLYLVVLWVIDVSLSPSDFTVLLVFAICLAGAWCLDWLINRVANGATSLGKDASSPYLHSTSIPRRHRTGLQLTTEIKSTTQGTSAREPLLGMRLDNSALYRAALEGRCRDSESLTNTNKMRRELTNARVLRVT